MLLATNNYITSPEIFFKSTGKIKAEIQIFLNI